MNERMYRTTIMGALAVCALGAAVLGAEKSRAAARDANSVSVLEKRMLASSTKSIEYRKGKVKSTSYRVWKKAEKVSLTKSKLTIKKKGWYSLLITTNKGKRKIKHVYFKKKTYVIPANTAIKQKSGYYFVVPKKNKLQAAEVQNASLQKGSNVSVWLRGDSACRSWKLESAGGKKFRLQNVNSGMYLAEKESGAKKGNAVQTTYAAKNQAQMFEAYSAGSGYIYLRCCASKQYLHAAGNNLEFSGRRAAKAWKFKMEASACPKSLVTISGGSYPSALQEGASFILTGIVSSRYTMKNFTVQIVNSAGKIVLAKSVNPNRCFYDIKNIDAAITFGKLTAGKYFYQIKVRDSAGKEAVWVNRPFTVAEHMTTINPIGTASNRILSYNANLIAAVGHQSAGNSLEKKACASYALAYCNAILYNSAPAPQTYWLGSSDVTCVWSKGGYRCSASGYGSESAVLQEAYRQILAGNPCILHVTGNTEQHWLCIIGYKNVETLSRLTASNLLAIDPWDGTVITVSSKYKVKSTYRLGVKN